MPGRVNKTTKAAPGLHHPTFRVFRYTLLRDRYGRPLGCGNLLELGVVRGASRREAQIIAARSWPKFACRSIRYPKGRILLCEATP